MFSRSVILVVLLIAIIASAMVYYVVLVANERPNEVSSSSQPELQLKPFKNHS